MRKTLLNAFVAFGVAVAMVASAPSALSASKKTPTPAADDSASKDKKSDAKPQDKRSDATKPASP